MTDPIPYPPHANDPKDEPRLSAPATTPAQGGWAPPAWMPIAGAVAAGAMLSVGAVLTGGAALTLPLILGAAFSGAGGGLAAYFGIKSAGPRKP